MKMFVAELRHESLPHRGLAVGEESGADRQFGCSREPVTKGSTSFTFVTDGLASAVAQARVAAGGGKDVEVMGADLGRQLMNAGLIDELAITLVPIVLGGGATRLGEMPPGTPRFEQVEARSSPSVTHLRYHWSNRERSPHRQVGESHRSPTTDPTARRRRVWRITPWRGGTAGRRATRRPRSGRSTRRWKRRCHPCCRFRWPGRERLRS